MYDLSKLEFKKWLEEQDLNELTPYAKTMIGIIIDHFDDIAEVGTIKGARARLIGKYIEALGNKAERKTLVMDSDSVNDDVVSRLESLIVENFRGFDTQEIFEFKKQYTFYHGANGSGKTSFCEALEYSTLGSIAEASARNISTDKYIIHIGHKKATIPDLKCKLANGEITAFPTNMLKYRFAFVEKNRIMNFSHIGAANAKTQTERIASLFGLSEFQTFVSEFTDSFDERYVTLVSKANTVYDEKNNFYLQSKKSYDADVTELEAKKAELAENISLLGDKSIVTVEQAKVFLNDPESGKLYIANKELSEHHMESVQANIVDILKSAVLEFLTAVDTIEASNTEILNDVGSLNLSELYKNIIHIQKSYKEDVCPVCRTPLAKAVENPFDYASRELKKFSSIEAAKERVKSNSKVASKNIEIIKEEFTKIEIQKIFSGTNVSDVLACSIQATDYETIDESTMRAIEKTRSLQEKLCSVESLSESIKSYNEEASANNKKYTAKVSQWQSIQEKIIASEVSINNLTERVDKVSPILKATEEELKKLKEKADKELDIIEFNQHMVTAYVSTVSSLTEYVKNLPVMLAKNLSDKVREYYNTINKGDADFELIDELTLPLSTNEKIMIKMHDGTAQDALQFLSEGHVRILGLSILLAKSVIEKMPFIVFDDIVNSVDDDHRNGVALLLVTHRDFLDTQMILTCHGEQFVNILESYVNDESKVARYMFLPADRLDERGVVIKYHDSTLPIKVAKQKYENDECKDCAAKCRQAVECITGRLWKKISPCLGGITVQIRNFQNGPDLSQIVSGLAQATISKKIAGIENIHDSLVELQSMRQWNLLNKGTHVDDSVSEFSRAEIGELLQLVERLNNEVNQLRIKPTAENK